jgi:uncharacterized protein (TIGR00369 family)
MAEHSQLIISRLCEILGSTSGKGPWTEHKARCSRSLQPMSNDHGSSDTTAPTGPAPAAAGEARHPRERGVPRSLDGISGFVGMRWDDPQTVRVRIRPELINGGGLLSGVVTYAMVDYCMGSTLWAQTAGDERIATISISINYVQTALEGEIICRTTLDRRNRRTAVMHSEVNHEDGRLLVTAIGSYSIFPARKPPTTSPAS